jgi:hypothetical protein
VPTQKKKSNAMNNAPSAVNTVNMPTRETPTGWTLSTESPKVTFVSEDKNLMWRALRVIQKSTFSEQEGRVESFLITVKWGVEEGLERVQARASTDF